MLAMGSICRQPAVRCVRVRNAVLQPARTRPARKPAYPNRPRSGTETPASHPASMTHLSVPDGRKGELGISDNLVRISIGIEDADDLIADFEQALAAV